MLIDTHVNVWSERFDPRHHAPAWLPSVFRTPLADMGLAQIDVDMTSAGVTGVVLVQTTNEFGHTDELLRAASESTREARVVGWLPISDPEQMAAALRRYQNEPALVGVRHRILDTEDPELLLREATARSLDLVSEAGLVLDVLPWPHSVLAQIPTLAARHPELTIVIDLMGWPDIASGRLQPWTDQLAAAGSTPNVLLKVGGFYRIADEDSIPQQWHPYTATAVEVFGTERMMVASDWPAVTMTNHTYVESIRSALAAFPDLTDAERTQLSGGTAARAYRF
ncbi:MAG: amidohydrolase family protein [Nakamurella sp.]